MRWDLDDLAAPSDLADYFYVGKPTISNWISRYADFPRPLPTPAMRHTKVYSRQAVIDWYERRDWQNDGPGSNSS